MKRRFRRIGLAFLFFVMALSLAVIVFFSGRGKTPAIRAVNSVATLEAVRIGDVNQWLLIRGADASKPVLLFLHGGPGMPAMFLAHAFQKELEQHFVIVHWDRRGTGKSYAAAKNNPEAINVRQTLDDTFQVTQLLRSRFGCNRIYLVCHSWGTYLGLLAIREHPEYYLAYVGMGQIAGDAAQVRALQCEFVLQQAKKKNDLAVESRVTRLDAPVTEDLLFRYHGQLYRHNSFWPILAEGLRAPEYTFRDALNVKSAADFVNRRMNYNVEPRLLRGEIDNFVIPIFFFLGRHDYNAPSSLAAEYLERLRAPEKHLMWFEESAHFPFYEEPHKFAAEMVLVDELTRNYWREGPSSPRDPAAPDAANR